jgi:hypothetical protein
MSNKKLSIEKVIEILTDNEVKIKEIYEALGMERMEFYNMRRGASNKKKEEAAKLLQEKFVNLIHEADIYTDTEIDPQTDHIQTLKRENELLRQLNERDLQEIKAQIAEIKQILRE